MVIFYKSWTGFFVGALVFAFGTVLFHYWVGLILMIGVWLWDLTTAEERLETARLKREDEKAMKLANVLVQYSCDKESIGNLAETLPKEYIPQSKKIKREIIYLYCFTIVYYCTHKAPRLFNAYVMLWAEEIKRFRGYGCSFSGFEKAGRQYSEAINLCFETEEVEYIFSTVGEVFNKRITEGPNYAKQELSDLGQAIFSNVYSDVVEVVERHMAS